MKIFDSVITETSSIISASKRETIQNAKMQRGKKRLEIGGPSKFFGRKSYYPVYLFASQIDGVNFSSNTLWEGEITAGKNYEYLKGYPKGIQFISEASELAGIENNAYDFVLSCHSLEHLANPIKGLKRWHEVLKTNGTLCLILPNKEITFDKNREFTTFDHLLADYENDINEKDNTHYEEFIDLHDYSKSPAVSGKDELATLVKANFHNRCVHHHVFSFEVIKKILEHCRYDVILQKEIHRLHLFTLAHKRN